MTKGASHEQRRDAVWVVLVWGRVAAGLTLAALGGIVFGHAWTGITHLYGGWGR